MIFDVKYGCLARCTKRKKCRQKNDEKASRMKKVIHNVDNGKIEKNELYTKLCTLSTLKIEKNWVYIVKKPNVCFVNKL